jgi:DNA repair and recombination RAD54-like protein
MSLNTARKPMMNMLTVPICLRPYKCPLRKDGSSNRTQESDILLRKKTLGTGRRPFVPFGQSRRPEPVLDIDIAGAEEPEEEIDETVEPLILWQPPPGSPDHWQPISVDTIMCKRLRPHQREGVQFCFDCVAGLKAFEGQGCILAVRTHVKHLYNYMASPVLIFCDVG